MLVIRGAQMEALGGELEARFERRVIDSVKRLWPGACEARGGDAEITTAVRAALEKGQRYGLEAERDLVRFVHLVFMLGDAFDADGGHDWAHAALSDSALAPSAKIDALFERLARG
ncbi:hypothetical protein [Sorangium sp. So ce131]|uniref:hypothetical protein n=1 Tax=Sorangium sp. So ce131 TaxID=3133282 RepID=UPI003F5FAD02